MCVLFVYAIYRHEKETTTHFRDIRMNMYERKPICYMFISNAWKKCSSNSNPPQNTAVRVSYLWNSCRPLQMNGTL